jgi:hypothetical protein
VIKHEGNCYTKERKPIDISSSLAEEMGGQKLMEPPIFSRNEIMVIGDFVMPQTRMPGRFGLPYLYR